MQSTKRPSPLPALHPTTTTQRPEVGTAYAQPTSPAGVLGASNRLRGQEVGVGKTQLSNPCLVSGTLGHKPVLFGASITVPIKCAQDWCKS